MTKSHKLKFLVTALFCSALALPVFVKVSAAHVGTRTAARMTSHVSTSLAPISAQAAEARSEKGDRNTIPVTYHTQPAEPKAERSEPSAPKHEFKSSPRLQRFVEERSEAIIDDRSQGEVFMPYVLTKDFGHDTYYFQRSLFNRVNWVDEYREAGIRFSWKDGKYNGFELSGTKEDGFLSMIGAQPGDVVTAVNGKKLENPFSDFVDIRESFKRTKWGVTTVSIQRGDESKELSWVTLENEAADDLVPVSRKEERAMNAEREKLDSEIMARAALRDALEIAGKNSITSDSSPEDIKAVYQAAVDAAKTQIGDDEKGAALLDIFKNAAS